MSVDKTMARNIERDMMRASSIAKKFRNETAIGYTEQQRLSEIAALCHRTLAIINGQRPVVTTGAVE